MNLTSPPSTVGTALGWEWKRRLDAICDRFEDAWRDGTSPRVEAYLDDDLIPSSRRAALLAELLKLERELRVGRGENPGASEYLARFPTYPLVIRSVFGEDRIGDYDLIAPIGEGGMGVVYRARHRVIGREVALKMIRPHCLDDASAVERFRLEAKLAASLDHEHIVTVYEADYADGQHYYAMRYIVGQSLSELIDRKPMEEKRAARYLEQVARAVDYAHTQGVLHRDLKPRNILIDNSDRAFVTDFGLAKLLGQGTGATRTDDRLGTPPYMSPEQVRDPSRAGVASDVYSLGVTLYEAVTGRPPFHAENPLEVYRQILDDEPTPPRSTGSRCSRDIETICLKCLEKDPARRYSSALALAEDLHRFLEGSPIVGRRTSYPERLGKWAGRHPTAAALVGVSLLAATAILGVIQTRTTNAMLDESDRHAREVVDRFTQLALQKLRDHPDLQSESLQISRRYYEDFLKRRKNDPSVANELAATLTRVARLNDALGAPKKALEEYEAALAVRRRRLNHTGSDRQALAEIASLLHEIGIIHRALGERAASIASYREALTIRESLVDDDVTLLQFVNNPSARDLPASDRALIGDLARSHGYIGDWEREGGQMEAARASYKKAEQLRSRLAEADPTDLRAKLQLARSENNAGILDREDGHPELAIKAHLRALALQRELVAIPVAEALARLDEVARAAGRTPEDDPDDFTADLCASLNYLGVLESERGHVSEAIQYHRESLDRLDDLAKLHPGLTRFDADRAWSRTYLGAALQSSEVLATARVMFESLLKPDPTVPRLRWGLARTLYEQGVVADRAGKLPQAQGFWTSSLSSLTQLSAEQPRSFDFRTDLLKVRLSLGLP